MVVRGWRVSMWLRRLGFGRNSMRRFSDRIESAVFTVALIASLIAVPLAIHIGQDYFEHASRTAAATAERNRQVPAVLLENAPQGSIQPGAQQGSADKPSVRAEWRAPDGALRNGVVRTDFGAESGDRVPVWTDWDGTLVEGPATPVQNHVRAAALGMAAALGWLLLVQAAYLGFRWLLDRRRLARWGEEWVMFERLWRKQRP